LLRANNLFSHFLGIFFIIMCYIDGAMSIRFFIIFLIKKFSALLIQISDLVGTQVKVGRCLGLLGCEGRGDVNSCRLNLSTRK
jgi:hypothetical protein